MIYKYFSDKCGRRDKSQVQIKRNFLLEEIKHNDFMSEKYKKTYKYLNYVEHLLIIVSVVTGCVSFCAFALLVCFPVGITNSAVRIKIYAITTWN